MQGFTFSALHGKRCQKLKHPSSCTNNAAKEKTVKKKEGEIATTKDDLIDRGDDKADAQTLLGESKAELETLKPMCVQG